MLTHMPIEVYAAVILVAIVLTVFALADMVFALLERCDPTPFLMAVSTTIVVFFGAFAVEAMEMGEAVQVLVFAVLGLNVLVLIVDWVSLFIFDAWRRSGLL